MEIFKTINIEGFDNYQISNFGRLKNIKTNRFLNPRPLDNNINMSQNGKRKSMCLHHLVANAFIENVDNKCCVEHIDENKNNNNVSNLRFISFTEINIFAEKHKRNTTGVKGVCFNKQKNKYQAMITMNGKNIYLGAFLTLGEAEYARQLKECEYAMNLNNELECDSF